MSPLIIHKIKTAFIPFLITGIITSVFICTTTNNWSSINFIISFLIGATIFLVLYSFSEYIMKFISKHLNILFALIVLSLFYVVVIIAVIVSYILIFSFPNLENFSASISNLFASDLLWYGIIFGIIFSLLMNFIFTVNTLLGAGILSNLIIGKYHQPKTEYRFFLFLDLKSSTTIAEAIGSKKFLQFLNEFYYDVSEPVVLSKGIIYKYVGDEIIISWKSNIKRNRDKILEIYYNIKKVINRKQDIYLNKFGYIPRFRASLHFGEVIVGELGFVKKEITYLGDVLNTSSRIHEVCKETGYDYIISAEAKSKITLENNDRYIDLGKRKLRGKAKDIELFAINDMNK